MASELSAALEALSLGDALRLMYGAYCHLGRLEGEVASSTRGLLRRVKNGEPGAFVFCLKKMLEEQEEVRLTLAGKHRHEGQSPRATMVNELQQLIYWPCLLVAGTDVPYEVIEAPAFLEAGLSGRDPAKREVDAGGRDEVAIFRRALAGAGRAVAEFNGGRLALPPIEPREVPLADLRQMAGKDYLIPYLRAELGVAPS